MWRLTAIPDCPMFVSNGGIETRTSQEVETPVGSGCDLPLGCCCLHLVFLSVLSCYLAHSQETPTENMELVLAALIFVSVCAFCLAAISLGTSILRILHLEMDTDTQHLLICAGVGVISIEMLLFGVASTQQIGKGCFVVLGLLCIALITDFRLITQKCSRILRAVFSGLRVESFLVLLIGIVLCVEFLASLAPLTGSDALHYHFTTQQLILKYGFHPDFSISHSFLCGQHHLLILLGLALGSEKLAMGLIFLGGLLSNSFAGLLGLPLVVIHDSLSDHAALSSHPCCFLANFFVGGPGYLDGLLCDCRGHCPLSNQNLWNMASGAPSRIVDRWRCRSKIHRVPRGRGLAAAITIEYRSALKTSLLCLGFFAYRDLALFAKSCLDWGSCVSFPDQNPIPGTDKSTRAERPPVGHGRIAIAPSWTARSIRFFCRDSSELARLLGLLRSYRLCPWRRC